MGSTVNERKTASLNFLRASLSPVFPLKSSSREVMNPAVPDAGSRRHSSASFGMATWKSPSDINRSTSARRLDGLRSEGVELETESDIERKFKLKIESAFQILDQQPVLGVDPCDAPSAECNCGHGLPRDNRSQGARLGECLFEIVHDVTNMMETSSLGGEGVHGRLFIGRFHQFPERITRATALEEGDANTLIRIVKDLLVPICPEHAGKALHGFRN